MIAAVYVPLWVPALFFCLLCLLPDAVREVRKFMRARRRRRAHRARLDALWRDDEVSAGRAISLHGRVATTPAGAGCFDGDAA